MALIDWSISICEVRLRHSREERRRQILAAALRVLSRKGFHAATNRDIAAEAGISPGLIYWYFRSKEELLVAALEGVSPVLQMGDRLEEIQDVLIEAFLRRLATEWLAAFRNEQNQQLFRVVFSEASRSQALNELTDRLAGRALDFVAAYLQRQAALGRIRCPDPYVAGQTFLAVLIATTISRAVFQRRSIIEIPDEKIASTLVEVFLRGLLPREDSLSGS